MAEEAIPVRGMLLDAAQRLGLPHPLETARIFGSWREMVGDQVAARCQPAGLGHGVLKVQAANPAWAHELRYLAPEVIRRVNATLGPGVVKELKVVVGQPDPGWDSGSEGAAAGSPGSGRATRRRRSAGSGAWSATSPEGSAETAPPSRPGVAYGSAPSLAEIDRLVAGISDPGLAAATKRALLAAKTRSGAG